MSLGIKSSWRSSYRQIRAPKPVSTLTLIPVPLLGRRPQTGGPRCDSSLRGFSSSSPESTAPQPASPTGAGTGSLRQSPVQIAKWLRDGLGDVPPNLQNYRESVLVPPFVQYPCARETTRSKMRHYKAMSRQARLEKLRILQQKPLPNWRLVLQDLQDYTPDPVPEPKSRAIKLLVGEAVARELIDGVGETMWDIKARTGCSLDLYSGNVEGAPSELVIQGPEADIAKAMDMVVRMAHETLGTQISGQLVPVDYAPTSASGALGHITTALGDWGPYYKIYDLRTSVHDIARPEEWTKESFRDYVGALTYARHEPRLITKLYGRHGSHRGAVISILNTIFSSPDTRPALSTTAFNMALSYMLSTGYSDRPDARRLFVRMEMYGLPMNTATFNILLASAVRVQDLGSFRTMLRLMIRRGFEPNLTTWAHFLHIFENEEVKRYILLAMHDKGMFRDPRALLVMHEEMAGYDADRAIRQGMNMTEFLSRQDDLYGKGWLNTGVAIKIMTIFGRHGRLSDCEVLLDALEQAEGKAARPNVVTFNTLLAHAKLLSKMDVAVRVLQRMDAAGIALDVTSYHLLFELAYVSWMPYRAVMSVVWRYACFAGQMSWRMRQRLSELLQGTWAKSLTYKRLDDGEGQADVDAETRAAEEERLRRIHRHQRGPADSRPGSKFVDQYYTRHKGWEPSQPISKVLERALELDRQAKQALDLDRQTNSLASCRSRYAVVAGGDTSGVILWLRRRGRKRSSGQQEFRALRILPLISLSPDTVLWQERVLESENLAV